MCKRLVLLLLIFILFTKTLACGCKKDKDHEPYNIYKDIYQKSLPITSSMVMLPIIHDFIIILRLAL